MAQTRSKKPEAEPSKPNQNENRIMKSKPREPAKSKTAEKVKEAASSPKNTLIEKGVIYFFTRARVDVEEPNGAADLQRTFFVLRPGSLKDALDFEKSNARLFALPKKIFPTSPKDRFMAFVEDARTSMNELKESFLPGNEYTTKTQGVRHQPAVMPVGEGVYEITQDGRTTFLTYVLTIPSEVDEVQKDLGVQNQGSFVISVKNPKSTGPSNAQLPEQADYPEEVQAEFGTNAWAPVKSEMLNYKNAQILLIGKGSDTSQAENVKSENGDEAKDIEELAKEDEKRVEAHDGNDTIFEDLHVSKAKYPLATTW